MKRSVLDLSVGVFILIGLLALGWLSVKLGKIELLGQSGLCPHRRFPVGRRPQARLLCRDRRRRGRSGRLRSSSTRTSRRACR